MRIFPKTIFIVAVAVLLAGGGCSDSPKQAATTTPAPAQAATTRPAAARHPFQSIPPQQAYNLIKNTKNLLVVDVRTPQEVRQDGAIEGSILLPFWAVLRGQHNLPKDRPLLVVCAVGGRSYAVGQALVRQQGYRQVYNLSGGIAAWKKAGLPVVHNP